MDCVAQVLERLDT